MTTIPYSVEPRADTGLTNARLGVWLFVASEVMLFGSLLSAYALLRAGAPTWPDQGAILDVPLGAVNTLVLLTSSITAALAVSGLARGNVVAFQRLQAVTIVLGLVFLGIKGVEYADEIGRGLRPATNNFLGLYFVLTSLHAAHLVGGIAVNAWLLMTARSTFPTEGGRLLVRVRAATTYWQFVDAVWLVLFVTLYLL